MLALRVVLNCKYSPFGAEGWKSVVSSEWTGRF